jgi:nucleotide-binding universal stress UspA family protein
VGEVVGEDPPYPLELLVLTGHPATVLTELSKDASLVVVGSRGHGGFLGLLLGSVVVVVRPGTCAARAA